MNKGWLKKICLGLMFCMALGVTACGASQDGQDDDNSQDVVADTNRGDNNQGGTFEEHNAATGGHLVGDGDFTSVSFDDGTSFACDAGGCTF